MSAEFSQLSESDRKSKMKFTLIFKVPSSAGQLPVPLAASMDDEKDASGELERYKGQAKKIMRQTTTTSPSPCTIEVLCSLCSRACWAYHPLYAAGVH